MRVGDVYTDGSTKWKVIRKKTSLFIGNIIDQYRDKIGSILNTYTTLEDLNQAVSTVDSADEVTYASYDYSYNTISSHYLKKSVYNTDSTRLNSIVSAMSDSSVNVFGKNFRETSTTVEDVKKELKQYDNKALAFLNDNSQIANSFTGKYAAQVNQTLGWVYDGSSYNSPSTSSLSLVTESNQSYLRLFLFPAVLADGSISCYLEIDFTDNYYYLVIYKKLDNYPLQKFYKSVNSISSLASIVHYKTPETPKYNTQTNPFKQISQATSYVYYDASTNKQYTRYYNNSSTSNTTNYYFYHSWNYTKKEYTWTNNKGVFLLYTNTSLRNSRPSNVPDFIKAHQITSSFSYEAGSGEYLYVFASSKRIDPRFIYLNAMHTFLNNNDTDQPKAPSLSVGDVVEGLGTLVYRSFYSSRDVNLDLTEYGLDVQLKFVWVKLYDTTPDITHGLNITRDTQHFLNVDYLTLNGVMLGDSTDPHLIKDKNGFYIYADSIVSSTKAFKLTHGDYGDTKIFFFDSIGQDCVVVEYADSNKYDRNCTRKLATYCYNSATQAMVAGGSLGVSAAADADSSGNYYQSRHNIMLLNPYDQYSFCLIINVFRVLLLGGDGSYWYEDVNRATRLRTYAINPKTGAITKTSGDTDVTVGTDKFDYFSSYANSQNGNYSYQTGDSTSVDYTQGCFLKFAIKDGYLYIKNYNKGASDTEFMINQNTPAASFVFQLMSRSWSCTSNNADGWTGTEGTNKLYRYTGINRSAPSAITYKTGQNNPFTYANEDAQVFIKDDFYDSLNNYYHDYDVNYKVHYLPGSSSILNLDMFYNSNNAYYSSSTIMDDLDRTAVSNLSRMYLFNVKKINNVCYYIVFYGTLGLNEMREDWMDYYFKVITIDPQTKLFVETNLTVSELMEMEEKYNTNNTGIV